MRLKFGETTYQFGSIMFGKFYLKYKQILDKIRLWMNKFGKYCTHTKFHGLNFCLKIDNYFCGSLFSWVSIFMVAPHTSYSKMLSSTVHVFALEGRQHTKPPWLPGTDLQLNTEANKLESVVYMCKVITERVTRSR